jgi:hypothetical protein
MLMSYPKYVYIKTSVSLYLIEAAISGHVWMLVFWPLLPVVSLIHSIHTFFSLEAPAQGVRGHAIMQGERMRPRRKKRIRDS